MEGFSCESESWVSTFTAAQIQENEGNPDQIEAFSRCLRTGFHPEDLELPEFRRNNSKTKKKNQVLLEGYVEASHEDDLMRTKSLTDEDLDELKGCLDLGFGFSYNEIPELCNTLPALELCYSMNQKFLDEHQKASERSPAALSTAAAESCSSVASPIANWRISSPGDHPEDVKARLKYWAQAVACTVRLCS